ncbi:2,5-diamino-6-ribosylamino-4(3H)-pyrimidinone 5'-phosphate reductase [Pseudocercospora fuligena]|uniref:2,5-diamino-6-ribosylamino-4(3H)-pyrimidinone 5'-phosphate reductase n=1 Tax=Pseudocercospora fuligena TaxID=685502 RepID=A0A8H6RI72_9PEZI|nr:2,5-diamino-6-ribosylamino-4(3H)-pyrimidinone 5'-phosphate reductase [Pseudocercospora fuligena]
MSDITQLSEDDRTFLDSYLPQDACNAATNETSSSGLQQSHRVRASATEKHDLPFVTLTYASSLDSMIALAPGARTTLSGPKTKSMTHYLRLQYDAILIGAGTAATDDPGLNCRYPKATLNDQPRPVIVDPNRRWKGESKKAFRLAAESQGKAPWIVTRASDTSSLDPLLQIGGNYLKLEDDHPSSSDTAISWVAILRALKQRGINSVMIEGGATVINTLLSLPDLVDSIIITVAPTFLGQGGVAVSPAPKTENGQRINSAWLDKPSWRQFGNDVVLCGRLRR